MDQPDLFRPHAARPRRRRTRAASPPPAPVWTAVDNPWDEGLRRDRELRGTGRREELAFRATLTACATTSAAVMPPVLYEAVMDHLTRHDADGHSLCFHSPLRERLVVDVYAWLDAYDAAAGQALRRSLTPEEEEPR